MIKFASCKYILQAIFFALVVLTCPAFSQSSSAKSWEAQYPDGNDEFMDDPIEACNASFREFNVGLLPPGDPDFYEFNDSYISCRCSGGPGSICSPGWRGTGG